MSPTPTTRTCPKCNGDQYAFRGRKTVAAADGRGSEVETSYRCKACDHTWKVRTPVTKAA